MEHSKADEFANHAYAYDGTPHLYLIHKIDDTLIVGSPRKSKINSIEVLEMPANRSSLNQGDCFVLDAGDKLYTWFGPDSSPHEKNRCNLHAEEIQRLRSGHAKVVPHDEDDHAFWNLLGGAGTIHRSTSAIYPADIALASMPSPAVLPEADPPCRPGSRCSTRPELTSIEEETGVVGAPGQSSPLHTVARIALVG